MGCNYVSIALIVLSGATNNTQQLVLFCWCWSVLSERISEDASINDKFFDKVEGCCEKLEQAIWEQAS